MDHGDENRFNSSVVFHKSDMGYPRVEKAICAVTSNNKIIPIRPMSNKPPVVDIDPGTLLFIGCLLILLPLLFTGFLSQ